MAIGLTLLMVFFAADIDGAQGDLDPSFGTGGKVTTDFHGFSDSAGSIAIDSSGRIVAAGSAQTNDGYVSFNFAVARYTAAGVLDTSFGSGGKVTTDFNGNRDIGASVAIDSLGRIVVVGSTDAATRDVAIARYTAAGALDTSFGAGGKVVADLSGGYDLGLSVAIDASGRIVVGGLADYEFVVARFTASGSLDATFGTGGVVTTNFGDDYDLGHEVKIDGSGRILLAGYGAAAAGTGSDFAVARYTSAGELDTSFGSGGTVRVDFNPSEAGTTLALDSNNRIVVGGFGNGDFALCRITASGVLDTTFGSGGKVITDMRGGSDEAYSVVVDSSGNIILGGGAKTQQGGDVSSNFALVRYTSAGALDGTFGTGGKVITDFHGGQDGIDQLLLDSAGNLIAAGYAARFGTGGDFALARYLATAKPGISLKVGTTNVASGGSYAFGSVELGQETSATVTITNTGDAPLTGITASISPAGNQDFRVGSPPPPSSIAAGASGTFTVIFSPQSAGNRTGSLRVASNAASSPYIIQLSGSGSDTTAPAITPQAEDLTIICDAAGSSASVDAWLQDNGGARATDNSRGVIWSHNFTALPSNCGSATVVFTASDGSGNTATTLAQIIQLDQTPPVITNQAADLTFVCDAANKSSSVDAWLAAHGNASATDNSGGAIVWSHNFTAIPEGCGAVTVTFTAKDPSGNPSTTSAQLVSTDNAAPTITTAASGMTVESDGQGNSAALNGWLNNHGGASASDTCTAVTWTHNFTGLSNTLPQTVPVTFSANDACGNSTTTNASFVIQDTTPPEITTPAKDYYGDCGQGGSQIDSFLASRGGAQARDIAGPVTWSHNYDGTLPACEGYITVTFTATDTVGLSVSTTARFFLFPPGAVWIGPATGGWNSASAWRSQIPTSALDAYVDLFDFQNSTVNITTTNATTKNLMIGQGDTLSLGNGASSSYLYVRGSLIRNRGTLQLNSAGPAYNYLWIHGPTALTGPGRVVFTGAGLNAIERGLNSANDVLTVSADQEITTTPGTIGDNGHTYIGAGIVNHGTITADGGGLGFYTEPKTNHGTFRAINGGTLRLQTVVNNADGTLFADAASVLHLVSTLNGGEVTGQGTLRMNSNVSINGPLALGAGLNTAVDSAVTNLRGTITNDGLLTVGTLEGPNFAQIQLDGSVTLAGNGKLVFQGAAGRFIQRTSVGNVLTVGAGQEITTSSNTVADSNHSAILAGIVNHGIITADQGGLALATDPKTNRATFRAINGGTLRMQAIVNNADGTLFADAGSVLHLQSTLSGGEVTGAGTLRMNSTATLNGPLTLGPGLNTAVDSAVTNLTGTITNDGLLTLGTPEGPTVAQIQLYGDVTLEGAGKLVFQGGAGRFIHRTSVGDVLTVGAEQEITTSSNTVADINHSAIIAGIVNHGIITADKGGLGMTTDPKTNHGTFRAINGGTLRMQAIVNNAEGNIFVDADSLLHLQGTLNGGEVTGEGTLRMNSTATLNGPLALGADLRTAVDSAITNLTGTITNDGLLTLGTPGGAHAAQIQLDGDVTLAGTGKLVFQGGAGRFIHRTSVGDILTVGAEQEITTSSDTVADSNHSAIIAGIVNHGIITADKGGLGMTSDPKTNHGTFRAINGGTLRMQAFVNNAEGNIFVDADSLLHLQSTLSGGEVTGEGTLRMNSTATLDGPLALGADLHTAVDSAITNLAGTITNDGLLTLGTPGGAHAAQIQLDGDVTLAGAGKLVFQGSAGRFIHRTSVGDVLTVGAEQEITTTADTVAGGSNSAIIAGIVNHGIITADKGGLGMTTDPKTNHGTFRAINGGSLVIPGSILTNYTAATGTLAGGRWEVVSAGDATLLDIQNASIAAIAGGTTVRLSGAGASLPQLSALRNISGTLSIENGKTMSTTGNMAIPGVLQYGLPAALETTRLAITGNVDFTGTRIDVLDQGMTSGSYLLATWTGSSSGQPVLGSLPPWSRHRLVLDPVARTLRLEITVVQPVNITGVSVTPGTGADAGQNIVTLSASGAPDTSYAVEASDDLLTWSVIAYATSASNGAVTLTIKEPASVTRQFYRLRVP